mgnify:CR=1 FL=1
MTPKPSTCLLLLFAASLIISASALGILVWVFGVHALYVLGGAPVLFVLLSLARDALVQARRDAVSRKLR